MRKFTRRTDTKSTMVCGQSVSSHERGSLEATHLEVSEEQGQVVVGDPADDHKQRYNECRNLLFETGVAGLVKFVPRKAVGRKPKAERDSRSSCRRRCR